MDELMMNMFSLIADQVRNRQELFDEEGKIMEALLNNGYHLHEADAALTLMQTLVQQEVDSLFAPERAPHPLCVRTMTREERERFTQDAFGFVLKLTRLGIISEYQREEVFDRAMTMHTGRIDLDMIKTLVAFSLFTAAPEREHTSLAKLRRIRNTAWN